jgi:hypothetical protein
MDQLPFCSIASSLKVENTFNRSSLLLLSATEAPQRPFNFRHWQQVNQQLVPEDFRFWSWTEPDDLLAIRRIS